MNCIKALRISTFHGSGFSLKIPMGVRFIVHSKVFTDAEMEDLEDVVSME